jgi:hypothetical protein
VAEVSVDDYAERRATQREWWQNQDGQQAGDPDKLAQALVTIAAEDPPRRFIAGADVLVLGERAEVLCAPASRASGAVRSSRRSRGSGSYGADGVGLHRRTAPTHDYQRDVIFRNVIADDVSHDVACDLLGGSERHCLLQTRESDVE